MNPSAWISFLMQSASLGIFAGALFGAMAGYVLASFGRLKPWLGVALGALVPVAGVMVLTVFALVRREPSAGQSDAGPWHWKSRTGKIILGSLAVLSGIAVAGFFVVWFDVRLPGLPALSVRAPGTNLGVALGLSLLLVVLTGLLSVRRPSRAGAVVLAGLGTSWLFLSGVSVAVQAPAVELATSLGALKFTVGDVLSLASVDVRSAEIVLPEAINPAALGLPGAALTADDMDLAAPLRDVAFVVGPGWYLMMAFALGLVVLALVTARLACKQVSDAPESSLSTSPALSREMWLTGISVSDETSDTIRGNIWTWNSEN